MNVLEDICPISEFRENASTMVAKVCADNRPLIITQYGKSSAVLISAEAYQEMLNQIEILNDIAAATDCRRALQRETLVGTYRETLRMDAAS